MCKWGDVVDVEVTIPSSLSHTGQAYQKIVEIDRCISGLVEVLNNIGMRTISCCCGHGKHRPCINLQDGRSIVICEAPDDPLLLELIVNFKEDESEYE
jgi:hypothetical protein